MRAKEYLKQLGRLDRAVHRRMKQLADMKADVTYVKGTSYDSVRVQTSPSGTPQAIKQVEEIADLEAQITCELAAYHKLRHKIVTEIEQLPDLRYQEILTMRYVDCMSLQEIADEMGYSYDWTQHMHGYALLEFQKSRKEPLQKIQQLS